MPKKSKGTPPPDHVPVPISDHDAHGHFIAGNTAAVGVRHPGRATLLTPDLAQKILRYIREGAFAWIAAEANGVSRTTFWEWVARGEGQDPDRPQTPFYAEFAAQVREAQAEARYSAEVEVKRGEPLNWLMKGPGRDRPGEPGWASPSDTRQTEAVQGSGPTWAQWAALQAQLLAILLKYPDVHQAAAQAFQQVRSAHKRNGDDDPTP
jgi:hypothetical protein